ncbi:MAG TPA: GlsB/YeaQ/YmgE family stress response membrane protein [Ktedonobacterales bacterium]
MVLAAVSSSLSLLGWVIIGGLAGWLAGKVMRGGGFGIIGDIIIGIMGALVGVFLLSFLVSADLGLIGSFVVALLGACILLALLRAVSGNKSRIFR